jgi:ribosomal protein L11 methyltransferase
VRWLELSIEADAEAIEAVSEIFGRVATGTAVHPTRLLRDPNDELAATPDLAAPFVVTAHVADGPDAPAQVDSTERALWHLQAFGLRPLGQLQVRGVEDSDWTERWKEHVSVQRIGRVVIVPSWIEHSADDGDAAIILDPGMAFGTGLHPTTRGCLELLQEVTPMPARILDVGCGSGILALAGLRLGANSAVGVDTDPEAVAATRNNAERNDLGDRIEVRAGTLPATADERFPLILANLVASVLIDLAAPLAGHLAPGGRLVASGIIEPRASEVIAAMASAGLEPVRRLDDDDWVSLVLAYRP